MGGAAAVVSALYGIASLRLRTRVIALAPLCENMPSGKAVKPGDVLVAKNKKTVEVTSSIDAAFVLVGMVITTLLTAGR